MERSGREVLYHLADPYRIQIVIEMCEILLERSGSRTDDG